MKNIFIEKPLHIAKLYVKALPLDENKRDIVIGCCDWSYISEEYTVRDYKTKKNVIINPYTICRNSCITDKNGMYVYEYDLLKLTHGMKSSCYGFLVWDDFYKEWKIRRRTDRTAYNNLKDWTIEVVGNIILNDADAKIIYNQEKEEDAKETFIDNSYCPSKFKK